MTAWLQLDQVLLATGLALAAVAALCWRDRSNPRRRASALFWAVYAALYLVGDHLAPEIAGLLVVLLALLGGLGWVKGGQHPVPEPAARQAAARRLGHRLFLPILSVGLVALAGSLALKGVTAGGLPVVEPRHLSLICLALGALAGLLGTLWLTRETPAEALRQAHRLLDTMGPAVVLPQLLATLGLLFTDAGVGSAVARIATQAFPLDLPWVAVTAYGLGMALFTAVMGNAFAAFPVMTAGIGIPVLLGQHHGDAAVMAAIGMFCGYCGTLMSPMAANFNLIPAALLELKDRNAVIRAQWPTALLLLAVNLVLMRLLMFR